MIPRPSVLVRLLAVWPALTACAPAWACDGDAAPVFACEAGGGRQYIELCAPLPAEQANGYLEYWFGRLGANGIAGTPELVFPERQAGSFKRFVGATYTRGGTYTQSVRFETRQARYTVFTESRGTVTTRAGVRVTALPAGKTATVLCNERPRFHIHELKGLLACDPSTPVGRACIG